MICIANKIGSKALTYVWRSNHENENGKWKNIKKYKYVKIYEKKMCKIKMCGNEKIINE